MRTDVAMVDIGGGILCNKVVIRHYRASTLYDTILTASRSANLTLMAHVIPMCYGVLPLVGV